MKRDGLTDIEAKELIKEACKAMINYLDHGEEFAAYDVCNEYFGLEPDYLDELL
jgi:hypothetical protein